MVGVTQTPVKDQELGHGSQGKHTLWIGQGPDFNFGSTEWILAQSLCLTFLQWLLLVVNLTTSTIN